MRLNRGLVIKTVKKFLFLSVFCTSFLVSASVFADESGGWIGTGGAATGSFTGGNSNCWENNVGGVLYGYDNYRFRIDCAKVSWIYYEAQPGGTGEAVTIAPDSRLSGGNRAVIPSTCYNKGEGGFWHYGVNRQVTSDSKIPCSWSGCVPNYSATAGAWGHWMTVAVGEGYGEEYPGKAGQDNSSKLHPDNPFGWHVNELGHEMYSGTTRYVATKVALSSDAGLIDDYKNALLYFDKSRSADEVKSLTAIESGVWGFCAWEGMKVEHKYYGQSNASNGVKYDTSGKVQKGSGLVVKSISPDRVLTIPSGGSSVTADLIFSHNIYADFEETNNVNWSVSGYGDGFSSGNVSMSRTNTPGELHSSSTTITNKISDDLFQATNRPFSDGTYYYISRDAYTVTFSAEGTYKFCENLSIDGVEVSGACTTYVVKKITTPECGVWTPDSYTNSTSSSGVTSVVSKVRNVTLGGDFTDSVYAKPRDNINWIHCYYPGVQKTASATATGYGVISPGVGNHGSHDSSLSSGGTTSNSYSALTILHGSWGNSFLVSSTNLRNPIPNGGTYTVGNSDTRVLRDNSYSVEYGTNKNKAGLTLIETSTSSTPSSAGVASDGKHSWACNYYNDTSCYHCGCDKYGDPDPKTGIAPCAECGTCNYSHSNCQHSNNYIKASWSNIAATDHADVLVPYNFKNTATIQLSNSYVYAGETASISAAEVQVRTKQNDVTNGVYATHVQSPKVKYAAYLSTSPYGNAVDDAGSGKGYNICNALSGYEACDELSEKEITTFNSAGVLKLGSSIGEVATNHSILSTMSTSYNVYDATAGKYFCVVAAVYPASSGADANMEAKGSDSWYVSAPSCAIIAKKPSIQVWGSGLFSSGKISTSSAEKRSVDGFISYTPNSLANTVIFGSWVEQGIVANGIVDGLASGASTAYPGNTSRTVSGLGGSKEGSSQSFCRNRSPITIPNANCLNGSGLPGVSIAGGLPGTSARMNTPGDYGDLIARFLPSDDEYADGTYVYKNTYTSLSQFTSELGSTTIAAGQRQTYVIDARGKTFTIDTDIQYADTYSYFVDIPKLIIRADNIDIQCHVSRIDAVLIADKPSGGVLNGRIRTCSDGGDTNSYLRSNQLKINGTVIAGYLEAGRTYGASNGVHSVIPAEIIDYDVSLYLWGSPRADSSASGKLDMVYIRELSPRL